METLFDDEATAHPLSVKDSYVNLTIVKKEEQLEKEKKQLHTIVDHFQPHDELLQTYETIYTPKQPLALSALFDALEGESSAPKKILILGRAGIGKTTTCQYIADRWRDSELWAEKFDAVLWLKLRELRDCSASEYEDAGEYKPLLMVAKILKHTYFNSPDAIEISIEKLASYLNHHHNRILWMLDGYDEVVDEVNTPTTSLFQAVDYVMAFPYVIVTSRPYYIAKVAGRPLWLFNRQLETIGFTDDNVKTYTENFFKRIAAKENSQACLSFLKTNPSLWGTAHVPINLELLCWAWSEQCERLERTITMTRLYQEILQILLRKRYLPKIIAELKLTPHDFLTLTDQDVEKYSSPVTQFLEELAFAAMQSNIAIIPHDKVLQPLLNRCPIGGILDRVLKTGFIKAIKGGDAEARKDYYFIHLTFQEFFAARHIAQNLKTLSDTREYTASLDYVRANRDQPNHEVMWGFVAGLLRENIDCWTAVVRILQEQPNLVTRFSLLVRSLEEGEQTKQSSGQVFLPWICQFSLAYAFDNTFYKKEQILRTLQLSPAVLKHTGLLDECSRKFSALEKQTKFLDHMEATTSLDFLRHFVKINEQAQAILQHFLLFPRLPRDRFREEIPILLELAEHDIRYANQLFILLADDYPCSPLLKAEAIRAVGILAINNLNARQLLYSLLSTKKLRDILLQEPAIIALANLVAIDPPAQILLQEQLEDANETIRRIATIALGMLAQKNIILYSLIEKAFADRNPVVRVTAIVQLGKIAQHNARIHSLILERFSDASSSVAVAAAGILAKTSASNTEYLEMLYKFSTDSSVPVQERTLAMFCLAELPQPTITTLSILHKNLGDPEKHIRETSVENYTKLALHSAAAREFIFKSLDEAAASMDEIHIVTIISVVGQLAEIDARAPKILYQAFRDRRQSIREITEGYLWRLASWHAETRIFLYDAIHDPRTEIRLSTVGILGNLAREDKEAREHLYQLFTDSEIEIRKVLVESLSKLITEHLDARKLLYQAYQDPAVEVRQAAIGVIGSLTLTDEKAQKLFEDAYQIEPLKETILNVLAAIVKKSSWARSLLYRACRDSNDIFRAKAVEPLVSLIEENEDEEARMQLCLALEDTSITVRRAAADLLSFQNCQRLDIFFGIGFTLFNRQSYPLALGFFDNVIKMIHQNRNPETFYWSIMILLPKHLPILQETAYFHPFADLSDIKVNIHKAHDLTWSFLIKCLYAIKDIAQAQRAYQDLEQRAEKEKDPLLYLVLADIHKFLGNEDQTELFIGIALSLSPDANNALLAKEKTDAHYSLGGKTL